MAERALPLVAAVALLSALALAAAGPAAAQAEETVAAADTVPIEWGPCGSRAVEGSRLECASVVMPLDHDAPGGDTIGVGLRRLRGTGEGARQLWYLAGGPGDAVGGALERLSELIDDPALDLYGIDHRGTGRSGRLECPAQEAPASEAGREIVGDEWAACIDHLRETRDDLEALTVSGSARDLGRAIELVAAAAERAGGDRPAAVVFGASYGSLWANRYLHFFPDQPAGVVLDGVVPADWSFAEFDASLDAVAREWLARCGDDAGCAARLGPNPESTVADVLDRLDTGHCPELGVRAADARLVLGVVLMVDAMPNALLPVLVRRWERCDWHDVMALLHFLRTVLDEVGEPETHSPVLQRHIALSEMWDADDPSADSLDARLERALATTAVSADFARTYPEWPRYEAAALDGAQADYDGPLLMLHGGLDPTVPAARLEALRARYPGSAQTFVLIPEAGHVTINHSECARGLLREFVADPAAGLDADCAAGERLARFEIDEPTSLRVLGTPDAWGESVSIVATAWYLFRFHWLPILIGLAALVRLPSLAKSYGQSRGRTTITVLVVLALSLGAYVLTASVPLILDYRSLAATGAIIAIVLVQLFAFGGLEFWLRGGDAEVEPA